MTTRKLAAETSGPITIDATIHGHGGTITVTAEPDCDHATLTIHTDDEDGPAAEAVRAASLRQVANGLYASVQGKGGNNGGTTVITGGGATVVQSFGTVTGSVTGMVISGGDVTVNGVRVRGGGATVVQGSSPIQITAIVPEGSSLAGTSQSADINAEGPFTKVTASTQSGDVRVGQAATINTKTQSGDIRLGRTDVVEGNTMSGDITIADFAGTAQLKTMSGDISVHATAGGDLTARTMSGDISVTATPEAVDDNLNIQPSTMSGHISVPARRSSGSGPRRR